MAGVGVVLTECAGVPSDGGGDDHGMGYARSAEFLHTPLMDTLRWLRVVGDTIFATGIPAVGWFVLGLKTGWSITDEIEAVSVRHTSTATAP